jgi:hypothetical protein
MYMPPNATQHLILVALLGTAIWGSWFYAVYRGVTLRQPPGRRYRTWLVVLGVLLLAGTAFVVRYVHP